MKKLGDTSELVVETVDRARLHDLHDLVARHPYSLVSGVQRYAPDVGPAYTRHAFEQAATDTTGSVLAVREGPEVVAATTLRVAAWETELLGVRVGNVGDLVAVPDPERRIRSTTRLLEAVGGRWAESGGGMLVARIDVDDTDGAVAAQRAGFEIVETTIAYLNDNDAHSPGTHVPRGFEVRCYPRGSAAEIPKEALQVLFRSVEETDRTGHLYRDRRLDPELVQDLYRAWVTNTFDGAHGDVVYAAWRDGRVLGVLSWTEDPVLDDLAGIKVLRSGFGAVAPEGHGALGDLYARVCADHPLDSRLVESTTQAGNEAVFTVWGRFASLRPASANYVLHGWFDA